MWWTSSAWKYQHLPTTWRAYTLLNWDSIPRNDICCNTSTYYSKLLQHVLISLTEYENSIKHDLLEIKPVTMAYDYYLHFELCLTGSRFNMHDCICQNLCYVLWHVHSYYSGEVSCASHKLMMQDVYKEIFRN